MSLTANRPRGGLWGMTIIKGGKAMTDREAEYRKETGDNPFNTDAWFNSKFISWLIQKLDKAEAERDELVGVLKSLKQQHHYCEDSWYSCPKHPDGCANDDITECNCGADEHNKKIDDAINRIKEGEK